VFDVDVYLCVLQVLVAEEGFNIVRARRTLVSKTIDPVTKERLSDRTLRKHLRKMGAAVKEENRRLIWKTTYDRYAVLAKMIDQFASFLKRSGFDPRQFTQDSALVFVPFQVGPNTYYDFLSVRLEQDCIDAFAKSVLDIRQKSASDYAEATEIARKEGLSLEAYLVKLKSHTGTKDRKLRLPAIA
jgi:hypothetical protein